MDPPSSLQALDCRILLHVIVAQGRGRQREGSDEHDASCANIIVAEEMCVARCTTGTAVHSRYLLFFYWLLRFRRGPPNIRHSNPSIATRMPNEPVVSSIFFPFVVS